MYAIDTDIRRNLISVRLAGMLTVEETAEYIAELRRRFLRERFHAGYRILIDVSDCTIQSQEMLAAMGRHMSTMPKASRIAMVTGSSLARMQIRRLMTQSYASVFAEAKGALDWITAEPVAA